MALVTARNLALDMSLHDSLTGERIYYGLDIAGGGFDSGSNTKYTQYFTMYEEAVSAPYYVGISRLMDAADGRPAGTVEYYSITKAGVANTSISIDLTKGRPYSQEELASLGQASVGTVFAPHALFGGNDEFRLSTLNDYADGGTGVDTAVYYSTRAENSITVDGGRITVSGDYGTDTLVNIERLAFRDGTLALDTGGIAGQAYRIYQAAFARTPDMDGLEFWIDSMDQGATLREVGAGFLNSDESLALYGGTTSRGFVEKLYLNILGREGEIEGVAFWTGELASGRAERADILAGFSESPENVGLVAPAIAEGIWIV
ncbi:MAG: DUF4214 domain-containing protein [Pseudomonadota bacterium]|nr:DUF4214 domain-containing protein [Pseudomonadota bacterium]